MLTSVLGVSCTRAGGVPYRESAAAVSSGWGDFDLIRGSTSGERSSAIGESACEPQREPRRSTSASAMGEADECVRRRMSSPSCNCSRSDYVRLMESIQMWTHESERGPICDGPAEAHRRNEERRARDRVTGEPGREEQNREHAVRNGPEEGEVEPRERERRQEVGDAREERLLARGLAEVGRFARSRDEGWDDDRGRKRDERVEEERPGARACAEVAHERRRGREVGLALRVGVDLGDPGRGEKQDGEPSDPARELYAVSVSVRVVGRSDEGRRTWTLSTCWIGRGSVRNVVQISPSAFQVGLSPSSSAVLSSREMSTRSCTHAAVTACVVTRKKAVKKVSTLS